MWFICKQKIWLAIATMKDIHTYLNANQHASGHSYRIYSCWISPWCCCCIATSCWCWIFLSCSSCCFCCSCCCSWCCWCCWLSPETTGATGTSGFCKDKQKFRLQMHCIHLVMIKIPKLGRCHYHHWLNFPLHHAELIKGYRRICYGIKSACKYRHINDKFSIFIVC